MAWNIEFDAAAGAMSVGGELTIFSALEVRDSLCQAFAACERVRIDLSGVTEIDTAGLQLMLLAKRKAGGTVEFHNHSDPVLRLLELANAGHLLGDPLLLGAR